MPLRLLSYNVRGGRGMDFKQDYRRIHDLLVAEEIDIALLQEFDTRLENRSTEKDVEDICGAEFAHLLAGKSLETPYGWYGNVLLSRHEILHHKVIDVSQPQREPRNIIEAFIQTPGGMLHVLNTHKGLNRHERRSQLRRLHEILVTDSQVPLVVAGDINEWQSSSRLLRDLDHSLNPVRVGPTYPTLCPLFHLDRVWCRPEGLIEARVLKDRRTRLYSDHYPILIEVNLG